MQVIYLDILLIFNLYMNYLLLSFTARITHQKLIFWRALFSAVLGSCSALIIIFPEMPVVISICYKIITAIIICLVAFGKNNIFWSCCCFLGISFLTAGAFMAISMIGSTGMIQNNASYYLDISLLQLVIFTIIAYIILHIIQYLHDRSHKTNGIYHVMIRYGNDTVTLNGLADTGNALVDFYTGKSVIICDKNLLGDMAKPKHSHPVPYMTVAGSGLLEVFQPDEILISPEQGKSKSVDALIGIGEQENQKAIFNPKLLYY
ncbi:MAG: sigma-E processing peptidase SpoIIGA [Oscillospiraceae bacterium]|nr:sigma-E processing peptidase SpoIIGA [Oscillospiraceae bacterium]